jgi:hypothetical protein
MGRGGDGAAGDVGEGGHAQGYCGAAAGDGHFELGEFAVDGGEADFEPLGFAAQPCCSASPIRAVRLSRISARAVTLGGVGPEHRAADAGLL